MARRFDGDTLVLATHNQAKVEEISDLLAGRVDKFPTAGTLGLSEPEETGTTFTENAILKVKAAVAESGMPALADDSGLAVNALNGEPGLYSARWAETENGRDFNYAMKRVHEALLARGGDSVDRSAAFVCVLALAWPDGHIETFEARCEGEIVWPPRGAEGHGYDPVFQPEGYDTTFAEMGLAEKQKLSHRGKALRMMFEACFAKKKPV